MGISRDRMKPVVNFINVYLLLFLTVLLICKPVHSCADEVDEFIDEIQSASSNVSSYSSSFIQEKHLAIFTQPVLFHGNLFVARPNRLRWEFDSPLKSVLIFNDSMGIRCDEKAQQSQFDLTTDPIMRSVAEQLWLWLGGDYKKLKTLFTLEKTGEDTLVVSPRKKSVSDYLESVSIKFDINSKQPQTVEILEPGGDLTRITFTSYVTNPTVSDSLFNKCNLHD